LRPTRNLSRLSRWLGTLEDEEIEESKERTESDNLRDYKYDEIERNVEVRLHSWELFKRIHKSANLSTEIYQKSLSPVLNCD
jgi:hypothetical protein